MPESAPRAVISVRVLPRSSREGIVGTEDGLYKVKLTAPAVEGKANKALIAFLAKALGLSRSGIEIRSGELARTKTVRIKGLSPEEVAARLTRV